jgi:hypothetical protein
LCHHSSVTGELGIAHAALAEPPPPPLPEADGAAPVELLLLVGVLLAPELAFLLELQALSPSAAIATMLIAAT